MRFTHHKDVVSLVIGFFETLPHQIGQPVSKDRNVRVWIDLGDLRLWRRRRQASSRLRFGAAGAPGLHIPSAARWWCVGTRPARLILVRSAWCLPGRPRKIPLLRVLLGVETWK